MLLSYSNNIDTARYRVEKARERCLRRERGSQSICADQRRSVYAGGDALRLVEICAFCTLRRCHRACLCGYLPSHSLDVCLCLHSPSTARDAQPLESYRQPPCRCHSHLVLRLGSGDLRYSRLAERHRQPASAAPPIGYKDRPGGCGTHLHVVVGAWRNRWSRGSLGGCRNTALKAQEKF